MLGRSGAVPLTNCSHEVFVGVIWAMSCVMSSLVTVRTTSAGQDFDITQTITGNTFSTPFGIANGTFAWSSSCVKIAATITQSGNTTTVDLPDSVAAGTTVVIGVKYDANSIKGAGAPDPTTVHYDFETTGVAGSLVGLNLQIK